MDIYSPCSGIVIYTHQPSNSNTLIRIFISPLHPHTVYSPISGKVYEIQSNKGWRIPAFLPMVVKYNAKTRVDLQVGKASKLIITVFAGLLTYKLISLVQLEQEVSALDEIVEIRFGSLVEIQGKIDLIKNFKVGLFLSAGQKIGSLREECNTFQIF